MNTKTINFLFIFVLIIIISCSGKNVYQLPCGVYRPKYPKFDFEALRHNYSPNPLIDTSNLYIKTRKYPFGNDRMLHYMGFYGDGRIILGNILESQFDQTIGKKSSFSTSDYIGYYTTQKNIIHVEYFLPGEGGVYLKKNGILKDDTIIFIEYERHFRIDTLVRSAYRMN